MDTPQNSSPPSTPPAAPAAAPALGRFLPLRKLGEGAQATVWLAHDPRLDREVALKVLHADADPDSVDQGLFEARAVSRLTHPNIVPVFEADLQDGQAYMVSEYVPGQTLAERLRSGPRLRPRDAVELMLGVLSGLQAAHAAGLVHRDLKPSNILLDAKGRPRVMDFGIAGRIAEADGRSGGVQGIVGTPGYISPEAARGEPPSPQMDVFAAAVMLAEMLSGQRLNADADPLRAVRRVLEFDMRLPTGLDAEVDDKLRAVVQRGLARDAGQRWPSAKAFHDALAEWLHPELEPAADAVDGVALEFLLRRMRLKSDFPAMSESIARIQRMTQSETESLNSLSNEILKDVALTHKLLRLVNTAHYRHAGGGGISTVSRAASLIGFAGIRNMALSLILLERMENKAHAQLLREEFLRALMAGLLARELCGSGRDSEECFLAAMFQNLGRLLCEFYFPEEAQQVRLLTRAERSADSSLPPLSEAMASTQVLGLSYEQLGQGVARQWGLPASLQRAMSRPDGEPPLRVLDNPAESSRWLARAANDLTEVILRSEPDEAHARLKAVAQRYARLMGTSTEEMERAVDEGRRCLAEMAQAMSIALPKGSRAQRLLLPLRPSMTDSLSAHELHATLVSEPTATLDVGPSPEQVLETLAAGIQDISNAMVESFKLNEILRMILETVYRSLGFRRVVFCLRDAKTEMLTGRFGLGDGVEAVVPLFKVPLRLPAGSQPDVFTAVCLKGADTLIADASTPTIAERLPPWFLVGPAKAASFLVLPLMLKGAPFAMIYADKARPGSIELGEKELSLLRTLRNQAVMAFRQAG